MFYFHKELTIFSFRKGKKIFHSMAKTERISQTFH